MAASDELKVILNGNEFRGWKTVSGSNNFEEITGEAQLTISEQPGNHFLLILVMNAKSF